MCCWTVMSIQTSPTSAQNSAIRMRQRISGNGYATPSMDYLEGGHDIHEASIEFQKSVRSMYLRQCRTDSHFIRIDCSDADGAMLPPDEIFTKIKAEVDSVLGL